MKEYKFYKGNLMCFETNKTKQVDIEQTCTGNIDTIVIQKTMVKQNPIHLWLFEQSQK